MSLNISVLCATAEEYAAIRKALGSTPDTVDPHGAFQWDRATRGDLEITIAQSSIGKTNAAALAARTIDRYNPDLLIFCGIAGALMPDLNPGDLIIASHTATYDYGAMIREKHHWFKPGTLPIGERPELAYDVAVTPHPAIDRAIEEFRRSRYESIKTRWGMILTGDLFMNCAATRDALFKGWGADAIDMESAAVVQIAERHKVPTLVLRTISDRAGEDSHMSYEELVEATAWNSSRFLNLYLDELVNSPESVAALREAFVQAA